MEEYIQNLVENMPQNLWGNLKTLGLGICPEFGMPLGFGLRKPPLPIMCGCDRIFKILKNGLQNKSSLLKFKLLLRLN